MFVIIEDGIVVSVDVDKDIFDMSIEAPDDIIFGDEYENGEFKRVAPRPEPIILTQQELREQSYETLKCITWESTEITVDEANKLFLNYFAENNPKVNEIQPLIIEAKEYIRTLYPDSEE